MKNSKLYPYGSAIISMLLWGMSFVWTAVALRYYEPVTIIFFRLVISTLLLFSLLKIIGKLQKINRTDYKLFILSALLNPFLYFLGENYGVKYTSPTISAVIIATIPLFAPIVAYFTLREKLSILNILGLIISFGGVLIMLVSPNLSLEASQFGIFALLFAVVAAIGYSILLKKLTVRYSPILIIAVQNLIGMIFFLPVFLLLDFNQFITIRPNIEVISSIVALAVFCSSIAFVAFTIATREIGVSKTNIFANLIPVFTGVFSFFIIGETLNTQKIIGIALVVGGLFFSQFKRSISFGYFNRY
jgi:drug/metabolite transporter (DMT)-like permease